MKDMLQQTSSANSNQPDTTWAAMQAGADLMCRLLTAHKANVRSIFGVQRDGVERHVVDRLDALQRRLDIIEASLLQRRGGHTFQTFGSVEDSLVRIADALAPQPADIVGSPIVAAKLGCTTTWVAEMARNGEIPPGCVVAGTGNGRPWKFYRAKIETWIESR